MRVFALLGALAVSGCVGESYYYHYGVMEVYPSASGRISNVSTSDTPFIRMDQATVMSLPM